MHRSLESEGRKKWDLVEGALGTYPERGKVPKEGGAVLS